MLRSTLSSWREYLTPAYHTSTFATTGELTPEEFVQAGDFLTHRFPTWQWMGAAKGKQRVFLPADKQVLVTRRVPSLVRVDDYADVDVEEQADGWTATVRPGDAQQAQTTASAVEEIDELVDETAEDDDDDDSDAQGASVPGNANKRFYDLYIHYSTAYRVPRMYLVGFTADGVPLTPQQMFEDISPDYRDKTVTIEQAPFLADTTTVSIHPCRHAAVMKVLINRAIVAGARRKEKEKDILAGVTKMGLADSEETADWEQLDETDVQEHPVRVDQYLVIFLKFITSVTPGVEHDYTMDAF